MLKVMIVGCGGIAPAHIEGYLRFPDKARIVALADRNSDKRLYLAEKYGLDAQLVDDYRSMLGQVDVVSVCTPPGSHAQIACDALESGCHVLLEKPMAPSLEECDLILEAAQKHNRVISVVGQSRFITSIRNTIDLVKSGTYGKLHYTRVHSVWYRGQSYYDLHWRGRWEVEGGGCTLNHSIHHIDLLLWTKGMPKKLRAFMTNLNHHNSEEEDFSSSVLTFADGSVAEITSSLICHSEPQIIEFQMEKAGVAIPFKAYASKPRENGFPMDDPEMRARVEADFAARPQLEHQNHDGQVGNFLAAILGEEQLVCTGQDGRNSIELIVGIYKSALTGQDVTFPITKQDPYYGLEWRKSAVHFNEKRRDVQGFADTTITNFKNKF